MIKKPKNYISGVKAKTQLYETRKVPHSKHRTIDSQARIDICLNCTKPASECNGNCFGRSN
jgi:hypothetical protein